MLLQGNQDTGKSSLGKRKDSYVVRCTIWYHLYNLKNVKNTHGRVLILVKLTLLHGYFSRFLKQSMNEKMEQIPVCKPWWEEELLQLMCLKCRWWRYQSICFVLKVLHSKVNDLHGYEKKLTFQSKVFTTLTM